MDKKKLRVGDWVQITETDTIGEEHFIGYHKVTEKDFESEFEISRMSPIPICSPLLESNGFVRERYKNIYHLSKNRFNYITIDLDKINDDIVESSDKLIEGRFNYLNELQHAISEANSDFKLDPNLWVEHNRKLAESIFKRYKTIKNNGQER